MFFIDKPYISDFFKATVRDNGIPVVGTDAALQEDLYPGTKIISVEDAVAAACRGEELRVYTTSENVIGWLAEHFSCSTLPGSIELFKDKVKFRKMIQPLFPDFYFQEAAVEELANLPLADIPFPVVVKPAVGFFSMGVQKVTEAGQWQNAVTAILAQREQIKGLYPQEVLDVSSFILEQVIDGEEFAVDAYYDSTGNPVILGIFKHLFSSDSDVSDRVYTTSREIIEGNIGEFTDFMEEIGRLSGVRNFPVHIELRRREDGRLLPIEVNPMRFGGWCSTPDMTYHAYGINPYLFYYLQKKPDWSAVLKGKEGRLFSLVVLDNSTGREGSEIGSFDYEKLLAGFAKVLELRKVDYKKYPVFGFLFVESREDTFVELENILNSDLTEFIALS